MPKLKPCPFCGGKAFLIKSKDFTGRSIYQVYCPATTVQAKTTWFDTEKEAVEAWNRRTEVKE